MQELVETMPCNFGEMEAHFCCPKDACRKTLARRDVVSMLDARTCNKVIPPPSPPTYQHPTLFMSRPSKFSPQELFYPTFPDTLKM